MDMAMIALLCALLCSLGAALQEVELHSSPWTLTNGNGSIRLEVANASSTHLNLMQAGVLQGDPYFRFNELLWSWVATETWRYNTSFLSTPEMLSHSSQVLRCQVDTISTVLLNGQEVGTTSDEFIVREFGVKGLLRAAGLANTLEVVIRPPLEYAAEQAKKYPYPVPVSVYYHDWAEGLQPDDAGWGNGTSSHRNFVRKAPSDFGWDWGPAFVPSGIASLALVARSGAALAGAVVRQRHEGDGAVVVIVEARLTVVDACEASLSAKLRAPSGAAAAPLLAERRLERLEVGARTARLELRVERPRLWWPVGLGDQPLYELELHLNASGSSAGGGGVVRRRIGLRTAELVQDPVLGGRSFFFRVNGVDVFARGSNLIPLDVFAPRAARDIEWILRSAVDANMNMVRVWGGGYYQADELYDLADELGLMIWQEMVFACSMYPRDRDFLGLVSEEIEQQALRLQHHASIVIWGGNNENEGAINWYQRSQSNRDLYVVDYVALYIETALPALRRIDPDVAFIDSSPSNGIVAAEPYVKRWGDVQDARYGDVHYYNYAADCEDASTYPRARFVSEHGFQSFPSFQTYKHVLAQEDWSHNSSVLFWRQRHPSGQEQMKAMLERHFRVPPEWAASPEMQREVFDSYLYLTQVQQSSCYETAFGQWRRLRSDPQVGTMGILYWQLNDIWPGPSWSSIEHSGAWRLTHSAVQRSFAPVLATMLVTNGTLQAFLTSDLTTEISAELHVQLRPWGGTGAHAWFSCKAVVRSGTHSCQAAKLEDALRAAGCSPQSCFAYLEGSTDERPPRLLSAHAFFTPLKDADLQAARLNISRPRKLGSHRASLVLSSDAVAVYATLEHEALIGRFKPNAFLLLPEKPAEVEFLGRSDFDLDALVRGLRVRSLRDTYGKTVDAAGRDQSPPLIVA